MLLQLDRLAEASSVAIATKNRVLVRQVADAARQAAAVDILADCEAYLSVS